MFMKNIFFKIYHKPGGINIRNRRDRADLVREIAAQQPQLVCIGPYYKMTRPERGEGWEDAASGAMAILDDLRTKYGFALLIEAHSPKGQPGTKRDLRPQGSNYLTQWPEIGIGLVEDKDFPQTLHIEQFRKDRLKASYPKLLERNTDWVVTGVYEGTGVDF